MSKTVKSIRPPKGMNRAERNAKGWRFIGRRWVKQQVAPRKLREPRNVIASFRLRQSEAKLLRDDLKLTPIAGVKSVKQFSRKLTIDYAKGRTVYVENIDRQIDPDAREKLAIEPPNCMMSDKVFLNRLIAFLSTEENWRKLRLFMLRAGWPREILIRYFESSDDQERLVVAQDCIRQMINENIHARQRKRKIQNSHQ